jgi:hypothetical protein
LLVRVIVFKFAEMFSFVAVKVVSVVLYLLLY